MAGHSQFKNVMYRKGAQDAKRARLFNKIGREITISVQLGGPDPSSNPRLRAAIQSAKGQNMPNERIERAIQRSNTNSTMRDEEIWYEGYGPGGVAMIIEAMTNNRFRTAASIRAACTKYGGTVGESNSVRFLFNRVGRIVYPLAQNSDETIIQAALDTGAQDVEITKTGYEILTSLEEFTAIYTSLEQTLGEPYWARLGWKPLSMLSPSPEIVETLLKLFEALNDNEDVHYIESTLHPLVT